MRRRRSAKIVATLGPASSTPERIHALFEAGVDVFRLNFSHGTHEDHRIRFETIRAVERTTGRPIGILADLQGPKLRLGSFSEGRIELAAGDRFRLDLDRDPGDRNRAPLPHPEIFEVISPGTSCYSMTVRYGFASRAAGRGSPIRPVWWGDRSRTAKALTFRTPYCHCQQSQKRIARISPSPFNKAPIGSRSHSSNALTTWPRVGSS